MPSPRCDRVELDVETRAADITDPSTPAALIEATVAVFGTIDILVADAGGPPPGHALDLDDAVLEAAINANLMSAVRLTRAAVPVMRREGWVPDLFHLPTRSCNPFPAWPFPTPPGPACWAWAKTAAEDLASSRRARNHTQSGLPGTTATHRCAGPGGRGDGRASDFGAVWSPSSVHDRLPFINGAALVVDGGSTLAL